MEKQRKVFATATSSPVAADSLIGVDWGASRVRAFRYDTIGTPIETRERACDLLAVEPGGFQIILADLTQGWAERGAPRFMMCGMVGSRQGWVEAPYVPCPVDAEALASRLLPLPAAEGSALIAPGLSFETSDQADVMRGEETQIFGAIAAAWNGVVLTPGTHSKWSMLDNGRITGFRTWMTGELFALLKSHSLLGRLMTPGAEDVDAFSLGVGRALEDAAITALVFSVRAEALLGRISPSSLASYLSGLLIGAEVAGGLALCDPDAPLAVIGTPALTALYVAALGLAGRSDVTRIDGDQAAARGLWRLAQMTLARPGGAK
jgi:2-dehydro-3-deoxygalactonokinase